MPLVDVFNALIQNSISQPMQCVWFFTPIALAAIYKWVKFPS